MEITAIEAKSLAPLTTLAANPPLRPQNVTLDPLVLYIARVPGSKDVFLSPLKPRQKVVTAEDVESCLYYLHVSSPEDELLLQNTILEEHESQFEVAPPQLPARPRPHGGPALPDVLRPGAQRLAHHPLPPIPPYPLEDGPPHIEPLAPVGRPPAMNIARKPAPSMPHRKPVGQQSQDDDEAPPALPTRPDASIRPSLASTAHHPDFTSSITVIRRSPVTGEQWNVGTISDPPVFDVSSDGRRSSMTSSLIRKSGQPLWLNISNPGYAKFIHGGDHSSSTASTSSTPSLTYSSGTSEDSSPDPIFTRRMWLEGSHFEKKAASHRKALSADQASHDSIPTRPTFSSHSSDSSSINQYAYGLSESGSFLGPQDMRRLSLTHDQKRSNTKGYTFLSPWDGRCEFASGTMGNSLKCRHLRQRNSLHPEANFPSQISELRFNLPGGGPMASEPRQRSPPKPKDKESRRSRFRAKFSSDHHRSSSYDSPSRHEGSEFADDFRTDMSLGQELAGGGFAGKQAKLGKLIIEGEGLMMLDLLVAANMALWFRAYEKFHSLS